LQAFITHQAPGINTTITNKLHYHTTPDTNSALDKASGAGTQGESKHSISNCKAG
jgi:hypothetical protein